MNGENPFVEPVQIAQYIRERSLPDDRIAVLGSEPQYASILTGCP